MKLSHLLASRSALVRQATLANAAFAYDTLAHWARRISRARLHGPVQLLGVDPDAERFAPQLIALAGNQSVLEEHFDEDDLARLADALAFVSEDETTEFEFRLEDLLPRFGPPLLTSLRAAGVELDEESLKAPESREH
jgi:hypothetical protein